MATAPCQLCEVSTTKTWCGAPLCWECYASTFPTYFKRGRPGAARADHGPDQHDLTCVACGATWVGPAWDPCVWCRNADHWQCEGQRTLLLSEPDVDWAANEDDIERAGRAWLTRMKVGVTAGLLTRREAEMALRGWLERMNGNMAKRAS